MTRHNLPISERIYPNLAVTEEDACWPWTMSLDSNGYGKIRLEGRLVGIHLLVYRLWHGEVPEGRVVGHRCHDEAMARGECMGGKTCPHRRCGNPLHLEAQTVSENTKRGHAGVYGNRRKVVVA